MNTAHISTRLQMALQLIHMKEWDLAAIALDNAQFHAQQLDGTVPMNRRRRAFIAQAQIAVGQRQ